MSSRGPGWELWSWGGVECVKGGIGRLLITSSIKFIFLFLLSKSFFYFLRNLSSFNFDLTKIYLCITNWDQFQKLFQQLSKGYNYVLAIFFKKI